MQSNDSYLTLARSNNFADYGEVPEWIAVMIELKSVSWLSTLKIFQELMPFGLKFMFWSHKVPVVSGNVRRELLSILDFIPGIKRYELAEAFVPHRTPSRSPAVPHGWLPPDSSYVEPGGKILKAVIDTGCPFAHRVLRKADGNTVVRAIWDQDRKPDFGNLGVPPARATCAYGAVLERKWLNAAIRQSSTHDYVGERACYALTGYGALDLKMSHGAHVLGLCTNGGCPTPTNDDADVLFVQLPRDVLSAPSRAALGKAIFDGVQWVLSEAIAANENAGSNEKKFENIVVNVSYSSALGPHDGSSIFERGLNELVDVAKETKIKLKVVFAAGNDFRQRLHARVPVLEANKEATLRWRMPPGNELPSFLELWFRNDVKRVDICVQLPSGERVAMGLLGTVISDKHRTVTVVNSRWHAEDARLVLIRIAPSRTTAGKMAAASGDYLISMTSHTDVKDPVHAYVSHAIGTMGYPVRGSQSYLVAKRIPPGTPPPPPTQSNSFVDPLGALNGLCCFSAAIVVGGYKYSVVKGILTEYPANYTASGPARRPLYKDCPDYSALTEEKPSLPGVRSIGNYSAVTIRMNGTSVATPQIARHVAGLSRISTTRCDPRLGDPVKFQCVAGPNEEAMCPVR